MKILRHFSIGMMSIAVACLLPVTGSAGHSDTEISTSLDQLAGVWSSEGYGQIVEIINGSPMRFDRFQISEESCLLIDSGPLE